ncbi:MAG: hypothetical protein JWP87_4674 [Labilithrix sp.]|nr:hypothetical protein [Labilithrix sp.]
MFRSSMWRPLAVACISVLGAATYACSAPGDGAASGDSASTEGELEIHFSQMYSAYDGQHDFKIPAVVTGVKKVKWSVSDPEIADIETQSDGSAMITVRKAGNVTIIAKAGSIKGEAPLTITDSKDNEWEAGNQRYNNGTVLTRGKGDGGGGGGGGGSKDKQLSCTNCHGGAGGDDSKDVEHTPMQTAGYSDAQLVTIFTKGQKPAGVPQRVMMNQSRWSKLHQWQMDEFAVKGLVVYLRSLEPKSQGPVDFGGRGPKGDGSGSGKGTGTATGSDSDAGTQ